MKILEFAKTVGKLKRTKRIGWKLFNIPQSESVAEHSFRVAILAMVLAPKFKLNQEKVTKMALIHDVGEAIVGDIIKYRGDKPHPSIQEIRQKEKEAIEKIFSIIDGQEYIKLYQEYEAMKTREAKFVKQIDRLEFMIQALEYEKKHKIKFPKEFSDWSSMVMSEPKLKKILQKIENLRKK